MKPSATSATKNLKPSAPRSHSRLKLLQLLNEHYPDAHCELSYNNPFELLVATVLSAQCTDVMVNKATPALFAAYPTAEKMSRVSVEQIEKHIKSLGLYRNKAKNLLSLAQDLVTHYQGQVPTDLNSLVTLAGVGRKTANVVLGNAFGITSGIVVDTHVTRLSERFGWTLSEKPEQIEKDLRAFVPREHWIQISHELIFHGRRVCKARAPDCASCFLLEHCPRIGLTPLDD